VIQLSKPKLVILAGGLGKRLRPFTLFLPKPMLPMGDRPILSHVVSWAAKEGLTDIIMATAYFGKIIEDFFDDGSDQGVKITYARSKRPLSSGGQLKTVEKLIKGTFVLTYSDIITDMSMDPVLKFHADKGAKVTIIARRIEIPLRFGELKVDGDGRLTGWEEKPVIRSLINAGMFVMEPDVFKFVKEGEVVSMDVVVRRMTESGLPVYVYEPSANFVDIADQESYERANEEFSKVLGDI
jgi:mannose-1-phosphate guanylyltransferase